MQRVGTESEARAASPASQSGLSSPGSVRRHLAYLDVADDTDASSAGPALAASGDDSAHAATGNNGPLSARSARSVRIPRTPHESERSSSPTRSPRTDSDTPQAKPREPPKANTARFDGRRFQPEADDGKVVKLQWGSNRNRAADKELSAVHLRSPLFHSRASRISLSKAATTKRERANISAEVMRAVREGDQRSLQSLSRQGLIIDSAIRDKEGNTVLHAAVLARQRTLLRFMLSSVIGNHLELTAQNARGLTPIEIAKELGEAEAVSWLEDARVSLCQQLVDAAGGGDSARVCSLVRRGAVVTWGDKHGVTALHQAAFTGHAHLAVELLSLGADASAVTKDGVSPLDLALRVDEREVVEAIRNYEGSQQDRQLKTSRDDFVLRRHLMALSVGRHSASRGRSVATAAASAAASAAPPTFHGTDTTVAPGVDISSLRTPAARRYALAGRRWSTGGSTKSGQRGHTRPSRPASAAPSGRRRRRLRGRPSSARRQLAQAHTAAAHRAGAPSRVSPSPPPPPASRSRNSRRPLSAVSARSDAADRAVHFTFKPNVRGGDRGQTGRPPRHAPRRPASAVAAARSAGAAWSQPGQATQSPERAGRTGSVAVSPGATDTRVAGASTEPQPSALPTEQARQESDPNSGDASSVVAESVIEDEAATWPLAHAANANEGDTSASVPPEHSSAGAAPRTVSHTVPLPRTTAAQAHHSAGTRDTDLSRAFAWFGASSTTVKVPTPQQRPPRPPPKQPHRSRNRPPPLVRSGASPASARGGIASARSGATTARRSMATNGSFRSHSSAGSRRSRITSRSKTRSPAVTVLTAGKLRRRRRVKKRKTSEIEDTADGSLAAAIALLTAVKNDPGPQPVATLPKNRVFHHHLHQDGVTGDLRPGGVTVITTRALPSNATRGSRGRRSSVTTLLAGRTKPASSRNLGLLARGQTSQDEDELPAPTSTAFRIGGGVVSMAHTRANRIRAKRMQRSREHSESPAKAKNQAETTVVFQVTNADAVEFVQQADYDVLRQLRLGMDTALASATKHRMMSATGAAERRQYFDIDVAANV